VIQDGFVSNTSGPDPSEESGSKAPMPPRTAIFYSENPLAIVRDFPVEVDRARALKAIERALSTVARPNT
jgi:hypothetical protein